MERPDQSPEPAERPEDPVAEPATPVDPPAEPEPGTARHGDDPARRWRRRRDYTAAAVIVVAVLVAAGTIWYDSDARATVSQTAPGRGESDSDDSLPTPAAVPPKLTEAWQAPSAGTTVPVTAQDTVVTGDGSEVLGRDPGTGQVRWRYARDIPLCTVNSAWGKAVAVFRKSRNCSEVTALDGATGQRGPQRDDNAELGTRLISDGTHVTAIGHTLLDVWRYDLVLTMQYGTMPDPVNPDSQPRTGCSLNSFAVGNSRVGVVEHCPNENLDRLTLLKAAPKDSDKPEALFSNPISGSGNQLVTISNDTEAVLTDGPPRLVTYDATGAKKTEYPLDIPATDQSHRPPGGVAGTTSGTRAIYWFTGSATVALSTTDLHPLWTMRNTLGPGVLLAGKLLVPVESGITVVDPETGAKVGSIPVDRHGYQGTVKMAVAGSTVLEQRGGTLVALK